MPLGYVHGKVIPVVVVRRLSPVCVAPVIPMDGSVGSSLGVDMLHDVDFAAHRPVHGRDIAPEHPKGGPEPGAVGHLDAGLNLNFYVTAYI